MSFDCVYRLYPYENAIPNTIILNTNQIDQFIWLELPDTLGPHLVLYEVYELVSGDVVLCTDYENQVFRDCRRPWLRIDSDMFNHSIGLHIYQFRFVDTRTNTNVRLYFSYRIQCDNPDRSDYVYMQRGGNDV